MEDKVILPFVVANDTHQFAGNNDVPPFVGVNDTQQFVGDKYVLPFVGAAMFVILPFVEDEDTPPIGSTLRQHVDFGTVIQNPPSLRGSYNGT